MLEHLQQTHQSDSHYDNLLILQELIITIT